MADKWTAIRTFWNSFGLNAYDESTVPEGATLPYITFEAATSDFEDRVLLSASLWYRSNSWTDISRKAEQINSEIGGGYGVGYDGGRLWITKNSPFAQRLEEPSDQEIRRVVLSVIAEFQ